MLFSRNTTQAASHRVGPGRASWSLGAPECRQHQCFMDGDGDVPVYLPSLVSRGSFWQRSTVQSACLQCCEMGSSFIPENPLGLLFLETLQPDAGEDLRELWLELQPYSLVWRTFLGPV